MIRKFSSATFKHLSALVSKTWRSVYYYDYRYLLTQHPDAQSELVQELQSVGIPCNGDLQAATAALNMDMLKRLPYCTAVLHEAMRIFPSGVAATPR